MNTVGELRRLSQSSLLRRIEVQVAKRKHANVFRIFPRALRSESLHSDVVTWLLQPTEWHSLDNGFAVALLRRWWDQSQHGQPPVELKRDEMIEVTDVVAEYPTGRGPIDILIWGQWGDRPFVLGIENKIGAPEGRHRKGSQVVGQFRDYGNALRRHFPDSILALALLTPEGRNPVEAPDVPWGAISYAHVADALDTALRSQPNVAAADDTFVARTVASHYVPVLRSYVMGQDAELDALCQELIDRYPQAWRALRSRLPSERDEGHRLLGIACRKTFEEHLEGSWVWAVQHRWVAVFRPSWESAFGKWKGPAAMQFKKDEVPPVIPRVHFRLALQVPDDDEAQVAPSLDVRLKCDAREVKKEAPLRYSTLMTGLRGVFDHPKQMTGDQSTPRIGGGQLKRAGSFDRVNERIAKLAADFVFERRATKVLDAARAIDKAAKSVP